MYTYFKDNQINGATYSTQLGMEMLNQYDLPIRIVSLCGEKLLPTRPSPVTLINEYGPAEFTIYSSYHRVDQRREYANIPIGRPAPNTLSAIADTAGNLVPRGVTGELCLIGRQIARGYWNRPELTAEKFIDCPFLDGEKMYRTGDLARWNDDGELEYLGRIDHQVKLRGFRIELGEIESAMARFEGIQGSVAEVKAINGIQHLCGYYTSEEAIDEGAMRAHLSQTLPDYMIPTAFVRLESMPLTPNGKVNRKVLPMPVIKAEEIVGAGTKKEEILLEVAIQILGTDQFGVTDKLEAHGLTSLSAIKLVAMAGEKGLKLKMTDVLRHQTIRKIASCDQSIAYWANGYDSNKPVLAFICALTQPSALLALTDKLAEYFSVLIFEPLHEHYDYLFHGSDVDEVVNVYTSTLRFMVPDTSRVCAFAGRCLGGEIAYRSAAKWEAMTGKQTRAFLFSVALYRNVEHEIIVAKETPVALTDEQKQIQGGRGKWNRIADSIINVETYPYYNGPAICFRAMQVDEIMNCTHRVNIALFNARNEEYLRCHMPNIQIVDVEADHYSLSQEQHVDFLVKYMMKTF